jgi:hypothetical protein
MKYILFSIACLITLSCNNRAVNEFEAYLSNQNTSAKDYILDQFEERDIVIFTERIHDEFTQYQLLFEIVSDPYFIENVGVVFTEIGCVNYTEEINQYLQTESKDSTYLDNALNTIIRNYCWEPVWPNSNYPWFLNEIRKLNSNLPHNKKIKVFPCDINYNWENIHSQQQVLYYDMLPRDSIMAVNVIERLDSLKANNLTNGNALVVMNSRHAYLKDFKTQRFENFRLTNTGRHIKDRYGDKVASVYLISLTTPNDPNKLEFIQNGYWDYLLEAQNKTNIGFDIANTPFGKAPAELYTYTWKKDSFLYQDLFTGFAYYNHYDSLYFIRGWEGLFDSVFSVEYQRRCNLYYPAFGDSISEKKIQSVLSGWNKKNKTMFIHPPERKEQVAQWRK